jgi:hypothetical protein
VRAEHLDIPPFLRILNPKHRIATIPRTERALCQWRGRQRFARRLRTEVPRTCLSLAR